MTAEPFVEEASRWLSDADVMDVEAPAGTDKATVLLADDNADMREYVKRLLAGRYDVRAVGSGDAALREVRARTPDLVLTDIMMPGLDGLQLLRALRADPLTRQTPIILLSACSCCVRCVPIPERGRRQSSCSRPAPARNRRSRDSMPALMTTW
jgi:CheY-like chemotaxis protein